MQKLGTVPLVAPATSGASITVEATNGTHLRQVNLSLAHWNSVNPMCGVWSPVGMPGLHLTHAGCEGSPFNASLPSTLSLRALGIGVHIARDNVTLFEPANDESDHITSVFVVVSMLIFAWAWFRWTRDLYGTIGHPWYAPRRATAPFPRRRR